MITQVYRSKVPYLKQKRDENITVDEARPDLDEIRDRLEILAVDKVDLTNDKFSVRTAVDKCVTALKDPCYFWNNLESVEQKQRFQSLIFPEGVIYENPGFRTAKMGCLFNLIPMAGSEKSHWVDLVGFEPTTSAMP